MNKTVVILSIIIAFLLVTNTALERTISNGVWSLGTGVASETQYAVEGAGNGILAGIDSVRTSIGKTLVHYKNAFKYDIDNNTANKSILSYVFFILLLFLSLFFVYKFLFYIFLFLFLYWLFIIIRNRF
jgi:hypothetical protein